VGPLGPMGAHLVGVSQIRARNGWSMGLVGT